ncbi:MAG: 50S ribosomal protein L22 [Patescibacteria group bacterium]|jgi:large subunit ribosomal protein L22
MQAKAVAKFVKISPRKARLVVDLIRNKKANDAVNILNFSVKAAAKTVSDVLKNAMTIAKDREMNQDKLIVKEALCDEGPRLKRGIAAGRGHYRKINKQMCHITIAVEEAENKEVKPEIKSKKSEKTETKTVNTAKVLKKEKK